MRCSVSNHQPQDCLLNRWFRRRLKKTSKLRVTGLCTGTGEFPAQMSSNAENVSIWWRHHVAGNILWITARWRDGRVRASEIPDTNYNCVSIHLFRLNQINYYSIASHCYGNHRLPSQWTNNLNAESIIIKWEKGLINHGNHPIISFVIDAPCIPWSPKEPNRTLVWRSVN